MTTKLYLKFCLLPTLFLVETKNQYVQLNTSFNCYTGNRLVVKTATNVGKIYTALLNPASIDRSCRQIQQVPLSGEYVNQIVYCEHNMDEDGEIDEPVGRVNIDRCYPTVTGVTSYQSGAVTARAALRIVGIG